MELDLAQPWVRLDDSEDLALVSAKDLIQLAQKVMTLDRTKGSFDEMAGRKIFRLPSKVEGIFTVYVQTVKSDDLDNLDFYTMMGGK